MKRVRVGTCLVFALLLLPAAALAQPKVSPQATPSAPTTAVKAGDTSAGDDAAVVKQRLVEVGLTREEADLRVKSLGPDELRQLRRNPSQLAMGGVKDTTLILIAVILIVPSILLLVMI